MPKKRITMSKIRDLLRLKFDSHLSHRDIASCLSIGPSTVSELLTRFKTSALSWPLPEGCSDTEINDALYLGRKPNKNKVPPNFTLCYKELKRKSMTKRLLWEEYQQQYQSAAYAYAQFCELYTRWLKTQKRSMRQHHVAGDKLFIDYCGPTVDIVNPDTGECRRAQIFVATLGASNYTYVEASEGQDLESWLMAHANAFEFFGGVPNLLVPDNLRSAIKKAHRYEPQLNDNYRKLANHYRTAVMPARPYKPKDKAKAENAVLIVERWILMRLRHQVFHTLASLNLAISELAIDLNGRTMRLVGASRKAMFELLDQPALKQLPNQRYEYTETKRAKVAPDYHVLYRKHAYSVPHSLVGQHVDLEATSRIVRLYHQGLLVAQHPRSKKEYGFTTLEEHMPRNHQHQNWSPKRLMSWGKSIGLATQSVVEYQLNSKPHPEQAYRTCLGLLSLARKYGEARLEQASKDALLAERPHRQFIENLLKNNREGHVSQPEQGELNLEHRNVRGSNYYH